MTVSYPVSDDSQFDYDYYQNSHMPLCARLFAEYGFCGSIVRTNISNSPGSHMRVYASVDLIFSTQEELQSGVAAHGKTITADIQNYTNTQPIIKFGEISLSVR